MRFVYVLTGWEGSAANSRVLRDALHRNNGLHVPRGNYYLCDNGYPNCEGFLTPYKGVRREMDVDPLEGGLDEYMSMHPDEEPVEDVDVIETLESSTEWNTWTDTVASNMFNEWILTVLILCFL
ncbi:hypothetical protein ACS0TY_009774 [Phlomoides rotata]